MSLKNKPEIAKHIDPSGKIVTPWTVFNWYTKEGMPVVRIGKRVFFQTDSVDKWLAERESGKKEPSTPEYGTLRRID